METLKNIIRDSNMSTRPKYYSGRGATISDLNSDILQKIYLGIEKEFGVKAAKNYLKMVQDIKVLSATTFLQELYELFYKNWVYRKKPVKRQANGILIEKDENGEYGERSVAHGMVSIFSALSRGDRDDTNQIRGGFLYTHGVQLKKKVVHYIDDGINCWSY